jgi:nucleotidyltransferase/DNA polymerase involved in DNA repair
MPVACIYIPHYVLRIAILDRPEFAGKPLVLSAPQQERALTIDASPEAHAKGVRVSMNLHEVSAICPDAIILMPDPVRQTAVAQKILSNLEQFSPLVEPDPEDQGSWYIDLSGLERHYGPPLATATRLLACVDPMLGGRVGIAPGKFAARVASGASRVSGISDSIRLLSSPEVTPFLALQSIDWLPLPGRTTHQLNRLGITTLGQFAGISGSSVAARFGPDARKAWDLAQGRDDRPVTPPLRVKSVTEGMNMPDPAATRDMLLVGLRQLVGQAFTKPTLRNHEVRVVTMRAIIEGDRRSWERKMVLKEPYGASRVINAINLRLQAIELPGPVTSVSLEFSGITSAMARQEAFPLMNTRSMKLLSDAIQHLKQRYGIPPIYHIVEVEPWSRIPERRHALIAYEP